MLILSGFAVSWALSQRQQASQVSPETPTASSSPRTTVPAPLPPREDVPGEEVRGLPRYPGSVRVGYERGERDGLAVIRTRYLTTEELDAVRGFYRGVFQSEGWIESDAAFSEDGWTFYLTDDGREATVRVSDLGPSVETNIELTEPLPEEPAPPSSAPEPAPSEAPPPPQQDPAPQYAPAPYDDDDDDFGDDGFDDNFDDFRDD